MYKGKFLMLFTSCLFFKFSYAKIPCDPESFQILNAPNNIEIGVTYYIRVGNREEIGCAINVSYIWTMFLGIKGRLYPIKEKVLEINNITRSTMNTLRITNIENHNPYEERFVLRVTLIPKPYYLPSYRVHYFNLKPEKLFIEIMGGSHRTHYKGSGNLYMNVTIVRESKQPINIRGISWKCFPELDLNSYHPSLLLKIPEQAITVGSHVFCAVTVTLKSGRVLTTNQTVTILHGSKAPVIEIICLENCGLSNPNEDTLLQCICHARCNELVKWLIDPYDNEILAKFKYPSNISNALVIPAGTFEYGMTYKIMATLSDVVANYTVHYDIKHSNLSLKCIDNCYIKHLEIVFKVTCHDHCKIGVDYEWSVQPYPTAWNNTPIKYQTKGDLLIFPAYTFIDRSGATVVAKLKESFASHSFIISSEMTKLVIECLINCIDYNPSMYVDLQVSCAGSCKDIGEYYWNISPESEDMDYAENKFDGGRILRIPAETYRRSAVVEVSVVELRFGSSAVFNITFAPPPKLTITCITNCFEDPLRNLTSIARVDCQGICENITYVWMATPYMAQALQPVNYENITVYIPAFYYNFATSASNVTVMGGDASASFIIEYKNRPPSIGIMCKRNCMDPAEPDQDVLLQAYCMSDCEDIGYIWSIESEGDFFWHDKVHLSYLNRTLLLKRKYHKELTAVINLETYPIRVNVTYIINFKNFTPVLHMTCISNCKYWRHLPISLKVQCSKNCDFESLYTWVIEPLPLNFNWKTSTTKSRFLDSTLTIHEFVFEDNYHVKVLAHNQGAAASIDFLVRNVDFSFSVKCNPRPCNKWQNTMEKFTISIVSSTDYDLDDHFEWDINPKPKGFDWSKHVIGNPTLGTITFFENIFPDAFRVNLTAYLYSTEAVNTIVKFREPAPDFQIKCIKNCNHSHPLLDVHLTVECYHLCNYVDTYEWEFDPHLDNFKNHITLTPRHIDLIIKQGVYKDGDIINVTARWRTHTRTLKVAFVKPETSLAIICLRNCKYNIMKTTSFEVNCLKHCEGDAPYTWNITESLKPPQFIYHNKTVSFSPESFVNNTYVILIACKESDCTSLVALFLVPKFELQIDCTYNCDKNNFSLPSKETTLIVRCLQYCVENMKYEWHLDQLPLSAEFYKNIRYNKVTFTIPANVFLNETCVNVIANSSGVFTNKVVCFLQPPPLFRLLCKENCGYPDPSKRVMFHIVCYEHCYSDAYHWAFDPYVVGLNPGLRKKVIEIPANTFQDGDKLLITVKQESVKTNRLITFATRPPVLQLACKPSCSQARPRRSLILKVICILNCKSKKEEVYFWDISPIREGFIWSLNTSLSDNNSSFTIKRGTYLAGDEVTVAVIGRRYSYVLTKITYAEKIPEISIFCKENCNYNPLMPVILEIRCKKCWVDDKFLECDFKPNLPPNSFSIKKADVIIESNSILSNTEVFMNCTYKKGVGNITMFFQLSPTNGTCSISPKFGYSAITEHTIDCVGFHKDVDITIYENVYKGVPGLELYHGEDRFFENIFLAPGIPLSITIDTGIDWVVYKRIHLEVISVSSLRSQSLVRNLNDEVSNTTILNVRMNEFITALRSGQFRKAYQLAFALEVTLEPTPKSLRLHYRKEILHQFNMLVEYILPSQGISFVLNHLSSPPLTDSYMLQKCLHIVEKAVAKLDFIEAHLWYDKYGKRRLAVLLMMIVDKIFTLTSQDVDLPYKSMQVFAKSTLALRDITATAAKVLDIIAMILKRPNQIERKNTTHLKIAILDLITGNEPFSLFLNAESSNSPFIEVIPVLGFLSGSIMHVVLQIAEHDENIFWWDSETKNLTTRAIYVSVDIEYHQQSQRTFKMINFIRVNLPIRKPKIFVEIKYLLNNNEAKVWTIHSEINYTLELMVQGNNVNVSIDFMKPRRRFINEFGYTVVGQQIWYLFTHKSPFYLGIVGSGWVTITATSLKCLAWHTKVWGWTHDGCMVSPKQINSNYITCDCRKFSFFAANSKVPRLEETVYPFKQIAEEIFDYPFVPIFAGCVCTVAIILFLLIITCTSKQYPELKYLQDNYVNYSELYLIIVQTGLWYDSGTTARVGFKIYGTFGCSKVHVLNFSRGPIMRRNSFDIFVIFTEKVLGDIKYLRLWHDSFGKDPHWFCDFVVVVHAATHKRYVFTIYRWFALIYPPYATKGLFKSSDKIKIASAKLEEALRENVNPCSYFADRKYQGNLAENLAVNGTSIAVVMATAFAIISTDEPTITDILLVILAGFTTTTMLDLMFRKSFRMFF